MVDDTPLQVHSPGDVERLLGQRIRELRLLAGWKQDTLARRAGVSLATVHRFERTGRASLSTVLRLCHALGRLDEVAELLQPPPARSLAELEAMSDRPKRQRGSR